MKTFDSRTISPGDHPQCGSNSKACRLFLAFLFAIPLAGCNGLPIVGNAPAPPANPAQTYLAGGVGNLPNVNNAGGVNQNLESYTIDLTANDPTANTFVVDSYFDTGALVQASGTVTRQPNGIYSLDTTYFLAQGNNPPSIKNWAVAIPAQFALTELETTSGPAGNTVSNTSFAPLAPTLSCPALAAATVFQFVTIPKPLSTKPSVTVSGWNPQIETAYGSAAIATSGTGVQFSKITQYTFPSANPGTLALPPPASATASCSPSFFGQTISYPGSSAVINPGGANQSVPPSATIGIGPEGFLLEDSGAPQGQANPSALPYENLLGAGYGALGLIRPSSPLSTSDLASAQYQGILYGAASGASADVSSPGFRWIGSFGYSNLQTSCPVLPGPAATTVLYGGEFAANDPSANASGNCDLAVDLGTQDPNNNGLYPAATVYVSAAFPNNGLGSPYSFPAVAVAGNIGAKHAIFLIGVDAVGMPHQPWGIYLLQSN